MKSLDDIQLEGRRVLLREDLNVPLEQGVIVDDTRIKRALPSITRLLAAGAAVIVMSHLGRPTEGDVDSTYSLEPVAKALSDALGRPVPLITNWQAGVTIAPGDIVLCENVRFAVGEKACDEGLSQKMAALCDVFVMDAFATAHRSNASTVGVAKHAPCAVAGPLLLEELAALTTALIAPKHPVVAIVGGSKVSTKCDVLMALLDKVDVLITGGGIANTLLAASGVDIGASLCEPEFFNTARVLLEKAKEKSVHIPLPSDVVVATAFVKTAEAVTKAVSDVQDGEMILDIGPDTAAQYAVLLKGANTIVWNGPVGVFEWDAFSQGTQAIGQAIAESSAYSLAGGGDTLAAIAQFRLTDHINYLSTGGGAFLTWMEKGILPGVENLS